MSNKTCVECQWYDYHHLLCVVGGDVKPADCACDSFTPIKLTNGDRIRKMSNEELVEFIQEVGDSGNACDFCVDRYKVCEFRNGNDVCTKGMIAWLNAPADCVKPTIQKATAMNNRFKFRAWDNEEKEYLQEGALLDSRTGNIAGYFPDYKFTIEQCTGLKDKNDKLIYEGDVFEADVLNSFDGDKFIGQKIRGQVAYYPDNACFTFAAYGPMNLGEIEIIGTIHDDQFRDAAKLVEVRK